VCRWLAATLLLLDVITDGRRWQHVIVCVKLVETLPSSFLREASSLFLPRCMECRRGLAMRILSVRLSVCLSVKRMICEKMEERSVQIFMSYKRSFSLVFWEEEWLVGGDPFYMNMKFLVNRPPLERNSRFLTDSDSWASCSCMHHIIFHCLHFSPRFCVQIRLFIWSTVRIMK